MTEDDKLKLLGLRALATHHNRMLKDIVAAAIVITGDPDDDIGHTADWLYNTDDDRRTPEQLAESIAIASAMLVGDSP
jgi:hypothetical protein